MTAGRIYSGLVAKIMRKKDFLSEAEVSNVQKNMQDAKDVVEGEMCGMLLKTGQKVTVELDDQIVFLKREIVARKID